MLQTQVQTLTEGKDQVRGVAVTLFKTCGVTRHPVNPLSGKGLGEIHCPPPQPPTRAYTECVPTEARKLETVVLKSREKGTRPEVRASAHASD